MNTEHQDIGEDNMREVARRLRGWNAAEDTVRDMHDRWLPSKSAIRHANALLQAELDARHAIIPLVHPGKTHGIWRVGELVETVPGVILLVGHDDYTVTLPPHSWARETAIDIARGELANRLGTVGYAIVFGDGEIAVFEE